MQCFLIIFSFIAVINAINVKKACFLLQKYAKVQI